MDLGEIDPRAGGDWGATFWGPGSLGSDNVSKLKGPSCVKRVPTRPGPEARRIFQYDFDDLPIRPGIGTATSANRPGPRW